MGGIYSLNGLKDVVEMASMIAGGIDALRERPFVSFITLIISPLKIDDIYGEMTCYLAEKGLPVVVPTEPLCGATSPVTMASNVLLHVAESLSGVVMTQLINPGTVDARSGSAPGCLIRYRAVSSGVICTLFAHPGSFWISSKYPFQI